MRRFLLLLSSFGLPFFAGACQYYYVRPVDPLTTEEIIELSKKGTPPEEIIRRIDESGTVYILDSDDVIRLREAGVDKKVVDHMLKTLPRDIERRNAYYYYECVHPYHAYPYPHWHFGYYCWW